MLLNSWVFRLRFSVAKLHWKQLSLIVDRHSMIELSKSNWYNRSSKEILRVMLLVLSSFLELEDAWSTILQYLRMATKKISWKINRDMPNEGFRLYATKTRVWFNNRRRGYSWNQTDHRQQAGANYLWDLRREILRENPSSPVISEVLTWTLLLRGWWLAVYKTLYGPEQSKYVRRSNT